MAMALSPQRKQRVPTHIIYSDHLLTRSKDTGPYRTLSIRHRFWFSVPRLLVISEFKFQTIEQALLFFWARWHYKRIGPAPGPDYYKDDADVDLLSPPGLMMKEIMCAKPWTTEKARMYELKLKQFHLSDSLLTELDNSMTWIAHIVVQHKMEQCNEATRVLVGTRRCIWATGLGEYETGCDLRTVHEMHLAGKKDRYIYSRNLYGVALMHVRSVAVLEWGWVSTDISKEDTPTGQVDYEEIHSSRLREKRNGSDGEKGCQSHMSGEDEENKRYDEGKDSVSNNRVESVHTDGILAADQKSDTTAQLSHLLADEVPQAEAPTGEPVKGGDGLDEPNTDAKVNPVIRALATPELLELILLGVPVRSIARARQVSTQWRNVIAGSKALLDRLHFIRPAAASVGQGIVTLNPHFISQSTSTSVDPGAKKANDHFGKTSGLFGIPFSPRRLLTLEDSDPRLDQLISQPPTKSVSITRLWRRQAGSRFAGEEPDEFQRIAVSAMATGRWIDAPTWGALRAEMQYDREYMAQCNREDSVLGHGRSNPWYYGRTAWLHLDDAVPDTYKGGYWAW